jgi:hypothetical protein
MTHPPFTTKLCLTPRALREAFRLRHEAYSGKEYIHPHPNGLFFDELDAMPGTLNFAVYSGTEIAGAIRACLYCPEIGWDDLPAAIKYPDEFGEWAASRALVVEWCRLAVSPQFTEDALAVELALLSSVPFLASRLPQVGFVCAVRTSHVRFYNRLGYERISGFSKDPRLTFESTLMAMDWAPHEERLRTHRLFSKCFEQQPSLDALDPRSRAVFLNRFGSFAGPCLTTSSKTMVPQL